MTTILIIDDDKIVREALIDILEIFEVEVLSASSGYEGIDIFEKNQVDVDGIIIDRRMPNLDGLATIQKLREIQGNIPVIMSSGYVSNEEESEMYLEKPNAYLHKPYEIQELIDLIKTVILK